MKRKRRSQGDAEAGKTGRKKPRATDWRATKHGRASPSAGPFRVFDYPSRELLSCRLRVLETLQPKLLVAVAKAVDGQDRAIVHPPAEVSAVQHEPALVRHLLLPGFLFLLAAALYQGRYPQDQPDRSIGETLSRRTDGDDFQPCLPSFDSRKKKRRLRGGAVGRVTTLLGLLSHPNGTRTQHPRCPDDHSGSRKHPRGPSRRS